MTYQDQIEEIAKQIAFAGRCEHDASMDAEEFWSHTADATREAFKKQAQAAHSAMFKDSGGGDLRADVERLRAALQASVAFADAVASGLGVEMSETIFTIRVMPSGRAVAARSWASVQNEARAALEGGDA